MKDLNDRKDLDDRKDRNGSDGAAPVGGEADAVDLDGRLREVSYSHQPDRARMLARVQRGMTIADVSGAERGTGRRTDRRTGRRRDRTGRAAPPRMSWPHVALAALTSATALLAGGYAVASVTQNREPAQEVGAAPARPTVSPSAADPYRARPSRPPVAAPPATHPTPSAPGVMGTASPTPPGRTEAPPRTDTGTDTGAGAGRPESGPLWADGSMDPHSKAYWAQSNITLRTNEPLSAFVLELRVSRADGATSTGTWSTLPEDDFAVTTHTAEGFLVYRWTLRAGRHVPVGEHLFAAQFNHAVEGHDANEDAYTVKAGAAGRHYQVGGAF